MPVCRLQTALAVPSRVFWPRAGHVKETGTRTARRTVFLITHRISTIRRADDILFPDGGRIVESGSRETLMGMTEGRYRAFVQSDTNLIDHVKDNRDDA